jgi:hypothetical protein
VNESQGLVALGERECPHICGHNLPTKSMGAADGACLCSGPLGATNALVSVLPREGREQMKLRLGEHSTELLAHTAEEVRAAGYDLVEAGPYLGIRERAILPAACLRLKLVGGMAWPATE